MNNLFASDKKINELIEKYGSPLYVYDEKLFRERIREMKNLIPLKNFRVNYSIKANSNLELLKIVNEEGLDVDAMSPGEIFLEEKAGFKKENILFISNNVSAEEMSYAIERGIIISVDSLSQLKMYGRLNPGGEVAIRFNAAVTGAGHHEKVITAGKKTKFGVQRDFVNEVKEILQEYNLTLAGINQHIGSLFLDEDKYIDGVRDLLEVAREFKGLKFVDMGGGFGIPYKKTDGRLDLQKLSQKLTPVLKEFADSYDNKDVIFKIEPGRYISAECCILLGTAHSVKTNYDHKYVGTDLGFNVLIRAAMYDSYHEVKVVKKDGSTPAETETVTIVGNICESGDIMAKDRVLPKVDEGDVIVVMDAGAYGYVMSSNYNQRLRPAEVLICEDGSDRLIRRRDILEDLLINFV